MSSATGAEGVLRELVGALQAADDLSFEVGVVIHQWYWYKMHVGERPYSPEEERLWHALQAADIALATWAARGEQPS